MIFYLQLFLGFILCSKYTIIDIPNIIEQGRYNPSFGMLMVKNFFIEDEDNLEKYGAFYDETGFDGLL